MMQALPTEYNSLSFSSRTESKWAYFFDEVNIPYEYEPEAFSFQSGTKYFPDFYLPWLGAWFEVKREIDKGLNFSIIYHKAVSLCADANQPVIVSFGQPRFHPLLKTYFNEMTFFHPIFLYCNDSDRAIGNDGSWSGWGTFCYTSVNWAIPQDSIQDAIIKDYPFLDFQEAEDKREKPLSTCSLSLRLDTKINNEWHTLIFLFGYNLIYLKKFGPWVYDGLLINCNPSLFRYSRNYSYYQPQVHVGSSKNCNKAYYKMLTAKFREGKLLTA